MLKLLKKLRHFYFSFLFKVKQSLPDPPPKQFQTTDQPGLQGLVNRKEFEERTQQEQQSWFMKANDLRDAIFDEHPVWKNSVGPIVQTSGLVYESGKMGYEPYIDVVPNTFNTWLDKDNRKKDYAISHNEMLKMQPDLIAKPTEEIHYSNNYYDSRQDETDYPKHASIIAPEHVIHHYNDTHTHSDTPQHETHSHTDSTSHDPHNDGGSDTNDD